MGYAGHASEIWRRSNSEVGTGKREAPAKEAGALVVAYAFGLQALAVASHIPPAF